MSDGRSFGRRGGFWTAASLIVLAFLIGGALTSWLVRSGRWPVVLQPAAAPQPVVAKPMIQPAPATTTAVAATVDPATLTVREGVLAGQLAALEARTASVTADALGAGAQAGRAEALLTVAATRRAIDHGLPLGYLEPVLRARFGLATPRAVEVVADAGHQPLTLEDLRQGLDALGPDLTTGAGQGWWTSFRREMGSLIVLHETGTPSPLPVDRFDRARRLLDGGQVEAARAEVARLPGVHSAGNWLEAARRYAITRRALDALDAAALSGRATAR